MTRSAALLEDETDRTVADARREQFVAAARRAMQSYDVTVLVPRISPSAPQIAEYWFHEVARQEPGKDRFARATAAMKERTRFHHELIDQVVRLTGRNLYALLYPSDADRQFEEDVRVALATDELVELMEGFDSAKQNINAWLDVARDAGQHDRYRKAAELFMLRHRIVSLDVDQASDISKVRDALTRARKARMNRPSGPRPTPRLLAGTRS